MCQLVLGEVECALQAPGAMPSSSWACSRKREHSTPWHPSIQHLASRTTNLLLLAAASPDCVFQVAAADFQHFDARVAFIVCFDEVPRRLGRAGPLDHLADGLCVEIPFVAVAVVVLRDLVFLVGRLFALLEALQLFVFADLQPELDDRGAVPIKEFFKLVDFLVRAPPLVGG